jgi:hypothetical protein
MQPDTMNIQALKFGVPTVLGTTTIDAAHTVHYATGYMFKQVQPRLAMATHLSYDEEFVPEMVAGLRTHWDGLFQFGAPDGVVVNVTKDAIWTRKAALPESTNFARPSKQEAVELFDISLTNLTVDFPNPRHVYTDLEGPVPRNTEYDAKLYYPPDVYRKPDGFFPRDFKINIMQMLAGKIGAKVDAKIEDLKENAQDSADQLRDKIKALQERLQKKLRGN